VDKFEYKLSSEKCSIKDLMTMFDDEMKIDRISITGVELN